MKIIQVVGYKNSGKTTLVSQLIEFLTIQGLTVGSLKHHGHGGRPSDVKNTDSSKHQQAGAIVSGVQGEDVFQLSVLKKIWKIEHILDFYALMDLDMVVVEGYKNLDYDKIVLIRSQEDTDLLDKLTNIKAVVSSNSLEFNTNHFHWFEKESSDKLFNWIKETYF